MENKISTIKFENQDLVELLNILFGGDMRLLEDFLLEHTDELCQYGKNLLDNELSMFNYLREREGLY